MFYSTSDVPLFLYFSEWNGLTYWVKDKVNIISPRTTQVASALLWSSVSFISGQTGRSCTPTSILNCKDSVPSCSCNSKTFIDGVSTSFVVTSESCIGSIKFGNGTKDVIFPATKVSVIYKIQKKWLGTLLVPKSYAFFSSVISYPKINSSRSE